MKHGESIEDFATCFLHLCHEIPEQCVDLDFINQELKHLVHVSRNSELPNFPSSSTLLDHETPHVSQRVPPCSNQKTKKSVQRAPPHNSCKADKSTQHAPNPSAQLSPAPTEEIPKWLRKPMVKTHPSILQEDITIHNVSPESNLHLYHPPSSASHESLHHDSLERSASQASCALSLDSQAASSSCGHVQGSLIIQAEEQDGEDTINSSENIELPFLIDPRSMNLGEISCTINSFDQPPFLGCHKSYASICCDEFPSTSYDLLSSHVHSN